MSTLKHLNLSEADFRLIIDGLEALPDRGSNGGLIADMMVGILDNNDPESTLAKIKSEHKQRMDKRQREREMLREDVRVLQGKLIQLKRYLSEQGALNEAHNILNNIS